MSYVGNKPAQKTIPVDDSVTTAMLKDDAVTSAKIDDGTIATADIADDAVTADKVANAINTSIAANTAKVTNATHTGDVTGATALTIAAGAVDVAMLSATGSASSSTVLYGDGTWKSEPTTDTSGIEYDIALLGFKVAANGSLAKYNLVDQAIDAFEDGSGVDASASTDEIRNSSNYYSGSIPDPSGGVENTYDTYTSHTFLSNANFVVNGSGNVDYFMVAGGGAGGGGPIAGGGGAGGYLTGTSLAVTAQTYAIVIGDGGVWNNDNSSNSVLKDGDDTTAFGFTALGGGGGGSGSGGTAGSGGSGGGTTGFNTNYGSGTAGPPRQGYNGGSSASPSYGSGGGGGAGAVGQTPAQYNGGDGGDGVQNLYRTGVNIYYAGGGGGCDWGGTNGAGGQGGGGLGSDGADGDTTAGTDGLGGGGGGGTLGSIQPDGGSGVVVVRYTTGSLSSHDDMTLISNATTAESAPTTGDLVITYTNGAGTATINTDLKAYISRDGSAYTSAVTLVDQGDTGGHTILTASGVDLSGITSGTSMRWKIETLNQSASKETRIQAVSLGWS